jgi:hypothetical protein
MSNEQRTAIYAVMTAVLAAAGTFGLINADEVEAYSVAGLALLGAASQLLSAVKTWKQRGSNANVTIRVDAVNAENAESFAAALRDLNWRGSV